MFDFALWADSSLGDISQRISYTLAEPPAGLPGDFNRDNKVDAADYVAWRKTNVPVDGYNVWVENFGRMGRRRQRCRPGTNLGVPADSRSPRFGSCTYRASARELGWRIQSPRWAGTARPS